MARLLDKTMANLPPGLRLVVEESCGGASPSAGLIWHAELDSRPLPGSKVWPPVKAAVGTLILNTCCQAEYYPGALVNSILGRGRASPAAGLSCDNIQHNIHETGYPLNTLPQTHTCSGCACRASASCVWTPAAS